GKAVAFIRDPKVAKASGIGSIIAAAAKCDVIDPLFAFEFALQVTPEVNHGDLRQMILEILSCEVQKIGIRGGDKNDIRLSKTLFGRIKNDHSARRFPEGHLG